jgi:hypothetical protein
MISGQYPGTTCTASPGKSNILYSVATVQRELSVIHSFFNGEGAETRECPHDKPPSFTTSSLGKEPKNNLTPALGASFIDAQLLFNKGCDQL